MRDIPRTIYGPDHDAFRDMVRKWVETEIVPHHEQWDHDGIVPRELWTAAGDLGLLGLNAPTELGGGGTDDYRFLAILTEEVGRAGVMGSGNGFLVHNDIVLPYLLGLGTEEQKQRWVPGMCTGTLVGAIAMTEPNTGSDLGGIKTTAIRKGDVYLLNGAKTFISNGIHSDVVVAVVRTDPDAGHRGISLLVVERGMAGFERGRNLDKLGLHAQDTAELFFDNVEVPATNLLGAEGKGFTYLMQNLPQERLGIAVSAMALSNAALDWTIEYTKSRTAFGQPIAGFQNSKFVLAELSTKLQVAQVYVDRCMELHCEGRLTAEQAAACKYHCTELQLDVVNRCLQLHGGYGYMTEYPIARAYADSRIQTIHGGTSEIIREIVGRAIIGR